jgi:aspartyl-tRNA(Asn)/glutamyl-tRNA(Gln) amidotransferase subunit A
MMDAAIALDAGIEALAEAIRLRRTSAVAVTRACLDRIAARDEQLHAFIAVEADDALARAAACDAQIAAAESSGNLNAQRERSTAIGPLAGVPIAIKDLFEREGRRTTAGSRVYAERIATRTAQVIARLERAGAVLIGTLNLDELAAGGTGDNAHYGRCRNPWDMQRITGGSSSGTAAAVAARLVPGALGSDTGGSLRLPAAYCGVTALKPTYGRVPLGGVFPRAPSFDCVGPAARSVDDCRLLFSVIADAPPVVATCTEPAAPALRIGIATAPFAAAAQRSVLDCFDAAAATFAALGVRTCDAPLPELDLITGLHQAVVKSEAAALHRNVLGDDAQSVGLAARSAIEAGLFLPPQRRDEALAVRAALLRHFVAHAFADADALLLPVAGTIAPCHDASTQAAATALVAAFDASAHACRFVNFLGLPALALPCGFVEGMPVGLQLVARPHREDVLFALGAAFQDVTGFHRAVPALAA